MNDPSRNGAHRVVEVRTLDGHMLFKYDANTDEVEVRLNGSFYHVCITEVGQFARVSHRSVMKVYQADENFGNEHHQPFE